MIRFPSAQISVNLANRSERSGQRSCKSVGSVCRYQDAYSSTTALRRSRKRWRDTCSRTDWSTLRITPRRQKSWVMRASLSGALQ